jgi:hypothetical protein
VVLRWIAVTGLALVSLLVATTILIAYSQAGSVDDAKSYQYRYRPLQMGTQIQVVFEHNGVVYVANCSLGFPAYYERVVSPDLAVVYYGVVTASHCGLRNSPVYQNVTGSNNYIGYMRDEGRFTYRTIIHDPNDVDATFVIVESYTYRPGSPRPPPQIVSAYIHHQGIAIPIAGYISSEQQLWHARNTSLLIRKAGRTTGYEEGYIRLCNVNPDRVACNHDTFGWSFITTAYGAGGDSGGPAYAYYIELRRSYAWIYGGSLISVATGPGRQIGEVISSCTSTGGIQICMPTRFTIVYNVTRLRGVVPLTAG